MQALTVFQTADGKQFTNRVEARKHEVELETLASLRTLLKSSIDSAMTHRGNVDNVLRHIMMEHAEVRKILTAMNKKTPKEAAIVAAAAVA